MTERQRGPVVDSQLSRRALLAGAGAAVAGVLLPGTASADTDVPFGLGVASGDPLPDSVILWTRLLKPGLSRKAEVGWQVARDERFRHVVRAGSTVASEELAHSVHVDVRGLEPGREYFYRFRYRNAVSPIGRTRTAPSPWARPDRLRLGVVSCQDFQNGYWPAYWGLADEDVDVVLHLGDYIYEYDPASRFPDRLHTTPQTPGLDQLSTLEDYRARHAQYKGDPSLRAAHAAAAWVVTWDDHEVENNYADLVDEIGDTGAKLQSPEAFARQRAAAYQAYYEHMPIRAVVRPGSDHMRIYRRFDFGRLAR
jgi:alkaline phosphatase D